MTRKMTSLNESELNDLSKISQVYYMIPILSELEAHQKRHGLDLAQSLDYLHDVLVNSKPSVERLLDKRQNNGQIKDKAQARKSIDGSAFSQLVKYIFLKLKSQGEIRSNIFITSNPAKQALISDMVTIGVGDETQKPDMDLAIYSVTETNQLNKCFIISLKTSLRERAGQTYKWKLLLEIATSDNPIKEKYNITYKSTSMPLVGFVTVNFYNEINNPQHRGMFQFFDRAFIGKPLKSDFIENLSRLPRFVNENL